MTKYPRCTVAALNVNNGLIDHTELFLRFTELGILGKWEQWAQGCTMIADGAYADDVERFLSGKPNED